VLSRYNLRMVVLFSLRMIFPQARGFGKRR
jgi:hypothetical protein